MTAVIRCPQCQSPLRIREEYAGKKLKCPKCTAIIQVPAGPTVLEVSDDVPPRVRPVTGRSEAIEEGSPRRRSAARDDENEPDAYDDRPRKKFKSSFKPCPRCQASGARRVTWTPWGSFYGPAMFTHVRCQECGCKYNGRTGRSNLIPAIIFVTIPLLLIGAIVGGLIYFLVVSNRWPF